MREAHAVGDGPRVTACGKAVHANQLGSGGDLYAIQIGDATGADEAPAAELALGAFPNPFNPKVTLEYALAETGDARLEIFAVDGARVAVLASGHHEAGRHRAVWNGTDETGDPIARHAIDARDGPVCAFLGRQIHLATEHYGRIDPTDLDEYRRQDGFQALRRCVEELAPEEIIARVIDGAREGKTVVRLKGGDPSVFGRGADEIEPLREAGIPFEIVPGITSALSAPTYAGIPPTHRDFTPNIAIVTGHRKDEKELEIPNAGTIVFLMENNQQPDGSLLVPEVLRPWLGGRELIEAP